LFEYISRYIVDGLIVFRTFSEKYTKHERMREKSELGGEFDSLSAPPLVFSWNSRMRCKKARPLRVSFHSSGFVYPLPDKKAPLARLSFVVDILFIRGSRHQRHHHCYFRCAIISSSLCDFCLGLFRGKKRDE